ncbi:MAG TPA: hypothetical protein DCP92_22185 [Nitrospiraceae bacterium]|nr:hypothetical protein [Nitrospiraceae bacterium]
MNEQGFCFTSNYPDQELPQRTYPINCHSVLRWSGLFEDYVTGFSPVFSIKIQICIVLPETLPVTTLAE